MDEGLGYEEAIRALRGALVDVATNARVFAARSSADGPELSARNWGELRDIEQLLCVRLENTLARELRVEPWTAFARMRVAYASVVRRISGEHAELVRLRREEKRRASIERWRRGAPALEAELWAFFAARTEYLANTAALALNEPTPFGAVMWHPRRRDFQSAGRDPV